MIAHDDSTPQILFNQWTDYQASLLSVVPDSTQELNFSSTTLSFDHFAAARNYNTSNIPCELTSCFEKVIINLSVTTADTSNQCYFHNSDTIKQADILSLQIEHDPKEIKLT